MYQDNWKTIASGHEKNFHAVVEGTVVKEWINGDYDYRLMSTGITYRRHHNYWPASPYGWNPA